MQIAKEEAALEDQWDDMIAQLKLASSGTAKAAQRNRDRRAPIEPGYVTPIASYISFNQLQHTKERKKNQQMARKMMDIIDQETELARQEEQERQATHGGQDGPRRGEKGG